MSYTYRNKTDQELVIPNVGTVKTNDTITSEEKLENQNLEEVSGETPQNPDNDPKGKTVGESKKEAAE